MRANREKSRPSLFWPASWVVAPIFNVVFRYRIRGTLPVEGPFILAANHLSELDPVVMGHVVWKLGRAPRFMAKESLFRIPVIGRVLTALGQIPVARQGGGQAAIEAAGKLIDVGGGVIVYPEGTLTREPNLWPMRGKGGAVRMAAEHGIPLIPAAHWGTQAVFARYAKRPKLRFRTPIDVVIDAPFDVSALQRDPGNRQLERDLTDALMRRITELQAELRGEVPPAELYSPNTATLGGREVRGSEHRGA